MTAAVAELAQLLVCLSRPPPVLLGSIGSLGRIGPRLPPAPRRERPSPASNEQFDLAPQVGGEPGVSFPVLGQADGQPRAVLVERARNPAPLRGHRLELLLAEVAQLASRPVARGQQLGAVVGADRVEQPLPRSHGFVRSGSDTAQVVLEPRSYGPPGRLSSGLGGRLTRGSPRSEHGVYNAGRGPAALCQAPQCALAASPGVGPRPVVGGGQRP